MGVIARIEGALGRIAMVTKRGALHVAIESPDVIRQPRPPRERYFSRLFESDPGVTDQAVDGSVTPVEFALRASNDCDTFVTHLIVVVADTTVANNRWGSINGLATGFDLKVIQQTSVSVITDKAVTVGEMIIQTAPIPLGTSPNAWTLSNFNGNSDAKVLQIPVADIVAGGLKLGINSLDRVVAVVNDDLTSLDFQTVRALGYCRFP